MWSSCATIGVEHYGRSDDIWKWNKMGAKTLDINIPMDVTEDDDHMDNFNKHRDESEENAEAKQEVEQEQHNADATSRPPMDEGATLREAPDMTDQPPQKQPRELKAAGTL